MARKERKPTNTLIATNVPSQILRDPKGIVEFLAESNHFLIELVALTKFERIIIICENTEASTKIHRLLKTSPEWKELHLTYSIKDNNFDVSKSWLTTNTNGSNPETNFTTNIVPEIGYLELPQDSASRRFLISPPLSPPAEWDHWDKVEEGPNQKAVYSPQELSHLLWERLGGFDSSTVRKYQEEEDDWEQGKEDDPTISNQYDIESKPEILFENIGNGAPAIVLDSIKHSGANPKQSAPKTIAKTAMPPPP